MVLGFGMQTYCLWSKQQLRIQSALWN